MVAVRISVNFVAVYTSLMMVARVGVTVVVTVFEDRYLVDNHDI